MDEDEYQQRNKNHVTTNQPRFSEAWQRVQSKHTDVSRADKYGEKMKDITFSLIEIFVSLIVETIILGGLFTFVSNRATVQNEQNINAEMKVIEDQNKTTFEQLQAEILKSRDDIISQIKESSGKGGIG